MSGLAHAARDERPHVESVGAGPPLVLLHGWGMHSGLFAPLLPALARRFRVHAVDLPGHGHSATVAPYTLDALADAVARALAAEPGPLAVLGWSFGGQVAMRWAARDPGRVARLVLVATTPRFVRAPDWPHAMAGEALARFGDELSVAWRATLTRFLTLQVRGSDEGRRTLAQLRHRMLARGDPAPGALGDALAVLASADLRDEARSIRAPALVVAGGRDTLVPAAAGEWLAQAMPRARLARIGDAAHAPFLSHRAAFDRALEAFVDAG
ncbi:pimeloyl-[acyl-carrier protein] methyl ester esterase [Burkholderiales bacterium]|nr:pimeloyl-[acyl-carrier protein] methyl ester esterase [Burkholderiales bacterium]